MYKLLQFYFLLLVFYMLWYVNNFQNTYFNRFQNTMCHNVINRNISFRYLDICLDLFKYIKSKFFLYNLFFYYICLCISWAVYYFFNIRKHSSDCSMKNRLQKESFWKKGQQSGKDMMVAWTKTIALMVLRSCLIGFADELDVRSEREECYPFLHCVTFKVCWQCFNVTGSSVIHTCIYENYFQTFQKSLA